MTTLEAAAPAAADRVATRAAAVPWFVWPGVLGSASITLGLLWDISWHSTVGRDTFWTPAHMAIYLGSVLAGLGAAVLVLQASRQPAGELADVSVRLAFLRAPVGAWITLWGTATMLTAAGFDTWWHDAYGLDVGILTPAHSLLSLGMLAVHLGALCLAAAAYNRAPAERRDRLRKVYVLIAGVFLMLLTVLLMEHHYPNQQHAAKFYKISAAAYPLLLAAFARAAGRWAATAMAAVAMGLTLAMLWILPLFSATPRLAPIFNPVEHMWPGLFPLLLILPALGFDFVLRRCLPGGDTVRAIALAVVFLAIFVPVQWHFSAFLLTPAARNAFFAADQWYFAVTHTQEGIGMERLGEWRYQFWSVERDPFNAQAVLYAFLLAGVSSRLGLGWGRWMGRLRR